MITAAAAETEKRARKMERHRVKRVRAGNVGDVFNGGLGNDGEVTDVYLDFASEVAMEHVRGLQRSFDKLTSLSLAIPDDAPAMVELIEALPCQRLTFLSLSCLAREDVIPCLNAAFAKEWPEDSLLYLHIQCDDPNPIPDEFKALADKLIEYEPARKTKVPKLDGLFLDFGFPPKCDPLARAWMSRAFWACDSSWAPLSSVGGYLGFSEEEARYCTIMFDALLRSDWRGRAVAKVQKLLEAEQDFREDLYSRKNTQRVFFPAVFSACKRACAACGNKNDFVFVVFAAFDEGSEEAAIRLAGEFLTPEPVLIGTLQVPVQYLYVGVNGDTSECTDFGRYLATRDAVVKVHLVVPAGRAGPSEPALTKRLSRILASPVFDKVVINYLSVSLVHADDVDAGGLWADLCDAETGELTRWYAGGDGGGG